MAQGKILVIRGGAIGDFILTLPVLSALRTTFPKAELHVLGYPHIARLALVSELADDLRSIEAQSLAGFFARAGNLSDDLCLYFSSFDIVISYLYDPDEIFQSNIARCSKAQFIKGPHRPNENENIHATEVFLKPLERLTIFDADPIPRLNPVTSHSLPIASLALHPGSGSEKKNWPEEKWSELLQALDENFEGNILLIGGEAEGEKLQRLQNNISPERLQLVQNLPLTELAQRLASCSFFIGHDSGITHLAAAIGLDGLALWGESNQNIWRPRSDKIKVLRGTHSLSDLSVSQVLNQIVSNA